MAQIALEMFDRTSFLISCRRQSTCKMRSRGECGPYVTAASLQRLSLFSLDLPFCAVLEYLYVVLGAWIPTAACGFLVGPMDPENLQCSKV